MQGEVSQQEFFPFDPEIERTCRRNIALNRKHKQQEKRARQRAQEAPSSPQAHTPPPQQSTSVPPPILEEPIMAEEDEPERRTLEDYAAHTIPQHFTSILRPQVQAANMSYPSSLIQLIRANQFHGLSHEDPYSHLATYLEICDTVKIAGVPDDAIRLNLFSFSLDGDAKAWLHSFKGHSLRTWDEVVSKFLNKYFPESKTTQGKTEISSFHQRPEETLSEAWDRFRGLLRKTPTHGFSEPVQINIFLDGLKSHTKQLLDASAGGKIKSKTSEEAIELIENMAASDPDLSYNRAANLSTRGVLELSAQDAMLAQNKLLAKQIEALTKQLSSLPQQLQSLNGAGASTTQSQESCQLCGGSHELGLCMIQEDAKAELKYMASQNFQGYNQGGNQGYNQGGNRGYNQGGNYNQGQNQWKFHPGNTFNKDQGSSSNRPPNQQPDIYERQAKLEDTLQQFMQASLSNQKSTDASIKNLEVQIGQLAHQMKEKSTGKFVATTETNPRSEHCNAIITRSKHKEVLEEEDEKEVSGESELLVEDEGEKNNEKNKSAGKIQKKERKTEKEKESNEGDEVMRDGKKVVEGEFVKKLPYPLVPSKKDKERYFARFLDIFKKLEITIPFGEAIQQMPLYAKFLKELLNTKGKYIDKPNILVDGNCSAIIQKTLPPKYRDPGSVTIPCAIGDMNVGKALVDLGASINLMPLSMLKRIDHVKLKPTRMTLQLADRSIKRPCGVAEDVLVKVKDFTFPVDFVIMDIEEDAEVPLILGRPFMSTANVVVDMGKGSLEMSVGDQKLNFNLFEAIKQPDGHKACSEVKAHHEKKPLKKEFHAGQQVSWFKSSWKFFPARRKSKWSRPFIIKEVKPDGTIELVDPSSAEPERSWAVKAQKLKPYHGREIQRPTPILPLQDP